MISVPMAVTIVYALLLYKLIITTLQFITENIQKLVNKIKMKRGDKK